MKIIYYTTGKSEVIAIKDDDNKIIKKGLYSMGNCLVDILYGDKIICKDKIIDIDTNIKSKVTALLEKCDDYLHNNIKNIVENDMAFIFNREFSYKNIFIENKLCRVYIFDDIHSLVCLLLTNIYVWKLMYKRCGYCENLFATRFSKSKFCKRIATQSGKTCGYASRLKRTEVANGKYKTSR